MRRAQVIDTAAVKPVPQVKRIGREGPGCQAMNVQQRPFACRKAEPALIDDNRRTHEPGFAEEQRRVGVLEDTTNPPNGFEAEEGQVGLLLVFTCLAAQPAPLRARRVRDYRERPPVGARVPDDVVAVKLRIFLVRRPSAAAQDRY